MASVLWEQLQWYDFVVPKYVQKLLLKTSSWKRLVFPRIVTSNTSMQEKLWNEDKSHSTAVLFHHRNPRTSGETAALRSVVRQAIVAASPSSLAAGKKELIWILCGVGTQPQAESAGWAAQLWRQRLLHVRVLLPGSRALSLPGLWQKFHLLRRKEGGVFVVVFIIFPFLPFCFQQSSTQSSPFDEPAFFSEEKYTLLKTSQSAGNSQYPGWFKNFPKRRLW